MQPDWGSLVNSASHAATTKLFSGPPYIRPPEGGDGGGGWMCFACGVSVKRGAPCFVMSRLWQLPGNSEMPRSVLDAVSSLQVCMLCTTKAGFKRLAFRHFPRLVRAETSGFYVYAQSLSSALGTWRSDTVVSHEVFKWKLGKLRVNLDSKQRLLCESSDNHLQLVGKDQCSECGRTLSARGPEMYLEAAIHADTRSGVHVSSPWGVARYCNSCSRQLFPIDESGRLRPWIW